MSNNSMKPTTCLWLWKNGDHFLAFDNPMPCYPDGGDPLVLGEPVGTAILTPSTPGWKEWNKEIKPPESGYGSRLRKIGQHEIADKMDTLIHRERMCDAHCGGRDAEIDRLCHEREQIEAALNAHQIAMPGGSNDWTLVQRVEIACVAATDEDVEPPEIDHSWADEDPGTCAKCGEPFEHVRPGKSQPTCDCWEPVTNG